MFLISSIINAAVKISGKKREFDLELWRLERWRTFEQAYYLLDHLVDPRRSAIDVGANKGIYAGRLAQLCPTVHCFEPIPWMARDLRKKLRSNVIVHDTAVSDTNGSAELRIPFHGDVEMHGTSTISPQNPLEGATRVQRVQCSQVRLDDAVKEPVGFIKIDVEGHELPVLRGASRILDHDRPVVVLESEKRHCPEAPEAVFRVMADHGYCGLFLLDNLPRCLSSFRTDIHQSPNNISGVKKTGLYTNNFIFIPS